MLGEQLVPTHVNLKGVVKQKEFFQRDNFLSLATIRRSLVTMVELLHGGVKKELRETLNLSNFRNINNDSVYIDVELERVISNLGNVVDLVKPAGTFEGSVKMREYIIALSELESAMKLTRSVFDPDRPMYPSEWSGF